MHSVANQWNPLASFLCLVRDLHGGANVSRTDPTAGLAMVWLTRHYKAFAAPDDALDRLIACKLLLISKLQLDSLDVYLDAFFLISRVDYDDQNHPERSITKRSLRKADRS